MKKPKKYEYEYVLQGYFWTGAKRNGEPKFEWEDLTAHTRYLDVVSDRKAYRENAPEMPSRIISRRLLTEEYKKWQLQQPA